MKVRRSICLVLISILMISAFPPCAFADQEASSSPKIIIKVSPLASKIAEQAVFARSEAKIILPEKISVYLQDEKEPHFIPVTWISKPAYNSRRTGTYIYKVKFPQEYQLTDSAVLPTVRVKVVKYNSVVKGITRKIKKKARSTLSQTVSISPAYGRTLNLQMQKNGKWVTKKTFRLSNAKTASIKISFPNDWWKTESSRWRITLPASGEGNAYTGSSITVSTQRYYQNPRKYIQIKNKINLKHSGAYKLNTGYMGLKVQKVNRYFKIGNKYWPRYTKQTKSKVKAFQKKKKLKATGIVDKKTWMKMGFSARSWSELGAYVSPIKVNPSSTKKDHVEAMINTAKKYLGSDYVVGASGKPSQGADCSGLVMQALYAAGVDPYPVSSVRHSKPGYEFESRNIWKNKKLKTVPYTKKKRGDLIFYKGRSGAVNHIAIYLGNGKVIESWPNKVVIWPVKNGKRSKIKGVKRVFN